MKKRLDRYQSVLLRDCKNCEKHRKKTSEPTEEDCKYCSIISMVNQLLSIKFTIQSQIESMEKTINENFHIQNELDE